MAFTINDLATELGIDVATLNPDAVSKWNGYLSDADTKYQTATQAQKDALDKLEQAKRDQAAIDDQIAKFGVTDASLTELRASNAALQAALEEVKKQGFSVNIPDLPKPATNTPDPLADLQTKYSNAFSQIGQALKVQTKYQAVFGKPFSDDLESLVNEASQQRLSVYDYAAKKYDFAGAEKKRAEDEFQAKVKSEVDAQVKKYQEEHPVTQGNPAFQRGVTSKHPQIFKPKDAASDKAFRNLPVKERIAASVARVRGALQNSAA